MAIWDIFSNKKKKQQAKRKRVQFLIRQAGYELTDERFNTLDFLLDLDPLLDEIIELGYFDAKYAEMLGIPAAESKEALTEEDTSEQTDFEQPISSGYNEKSVANNVADEAQEIADKTESVTYASESETPLRYTSSHETSSFDSSSSSSYDSGSDSSSDY